MTTPKQTAQSSSHEDPPRARRPELPRDAPHRAAGHAFRSAARPDTNNDEARAVIEGAVSTAYKVWREYVECGRSAAEQYTPFRDWSAAMTSDLPPDQNPMGPWLQLWQQMARTWMTYMMPFAPGAAPSFPFMPFAAPGVPPASDLSVEIQTDQPVTVSVRLSRPLAGSKLRAVLFNNRNQLLHFEFGPTLALKLPPDAPAGTYTGAVLDEAGNSYGTLTLQVGHSSSRRG